MDPKAIRGVAYSITALRGKTIFPPMIADERRPALRSSFQVDTAGPGFQNYSGPVKFSYQESGQINAQMQSTERLTNYPKIHQVPIARLTGGHIFTLECEGLRMFEAATPAEAQRSDFIAIDVADTLERLHVAVYGGFSDEQILNKYRSDRGVVFLQRYVSVPPITVTFQRPHLPAPFKLAFYAFAAATVQTGSENPNLLAMMGLNPAAPKLEYICVHASDPEERIPMS